jgi:hypothetical protein
MDRNDFEPGILNDVFCAKSEGKSYLRNVFSLTYTYISWRSIVQYESVLVISLYIKDTNILILTAVILMISALLTKLKLEERKSLS